MFKPGDLVRFVLTLANHNHEDAALAGIIGVVKVEPPCKCEGYAVGQLAYPVFWLSARAPSFDKCGNSKDKYHETALELFEPSMEEA